MLLDTELRKIYTRVRKMYDPDFVRVEIEDWGKLHPEEQRQSIRAVLHHLEEYLSKHLGTLKDERKVRDSVKNEIRFLQGT